MQTFPAYEEHANSILADVNPADKNPAAQVADRSSTIKITKLTATWASSNVFLKIETNRGITGWGDLKGVDLRVGKVLAESLFELIDGENPTRIEHLWQKLYRAHRNIRGGAFMVHTIAAIDMALWDIAASCGTCRSIGCSAGRRAIASASITPTKPRNCRPAGRTNTR